MIGRVRAMPLLVRRITMDKSAIYVARSDVALPLGWSLRQIDIVHSPSAAVWIWRFSKPSTLSIWHLRNTFIHSELRTAVPGTRRDLSPKFESTQRTFERRGSTDFIEEIWRRRPDLNRGWRFCRPYRIVTRSAWLRLLVLDVAWFSVVFGRCCSEVAPKFVNRPTRIGSCCPNPSRRLLCSGNRFPHPL